MRNTGELMKHIINHGIDHKNRGHTVKISDTTKILQKYRNSALTYDLIRKIVYDINDSARSPMKTDNNDIRMI
jgi:hypothetical protein